MTGKDRAYWLADKIPAYGDYAKEAAISLRIQADEIEHLRARIDALMFEHCPDEMTPEQIAEWERHQQPVPNA